MVPWPTTAVAVPPHSFPKNSLLKILLPDTKKIVQPEVARQIPFSGPVAQSVRAGATGPLKVKDSELKPVKSAIEVLFDKQLGQIVKVKSMVQIKGSMTFEANGMELPGKLDLTMENNMALGLAKGK